MYSKPGDFAKYAAEEEEQRPKRSIVQKTPPNESQQRAKMTIDQAKRQMAERQTQRQGRPSAIGRLFEAQRQGGHFFQGARPAPAPQGAASQMAPISRESAPAPQTRRERPSPTVAPLQIPDAVTTPAAEAKPVGSRVPAAPAAAAPAAAAPAAAAPAAAAPAAAAPAAAAPGYSELLQRAARQATQAIQQAGPAAGQLWEDYAPGAQGILSALGGARDFLADMPRALLYGGRQAFGGEAADEAIAPFAGDVLTPVSPSEVERARRQRNAAEQARAERAGLNYSPYADAYYEDPLSARVRRAMGFPELTIHERPTPLGEQATPSMPEGMTSDQAEQWLDLWRRERLARGHTVGDLPPNIHRYPGGSPPYMEQLQELLSGLNQQYNPWATKTSAARLTPEEFLLKLAAITPPKSTPRATELQELARRVRGE